MSDFSDTPDTFALRLMQSVAKPELVFFVFLCEFNDEVTKLYIESN